MTSGGTTLKVFKTKRDYVLAVVGVAALMGTAVIAQNRAKENEARHFRGQLGSNTTKIKKEGDKVYLWAAGDRGGDSAEWYDFTGAPLDPEKLQFGIGRDRIPAIDDPLFVSPDDPRLVKMIPPSPYRPMQKAERNDDIHVIGFVEGDEAKAYPIALLDHHELVNDVVGGLPVTVGW
jgi:hypothetical protein